MLRYFEWHQSTTRWVLVLVAVFMLLLKGVGSSTSAYRTDEGMRPGPLPLPVSHHSDVPATEVTSCVYDGIRYDVGRFVLSGCVQCECFSSGHMACSAGACLESDSAEEPIPEPEPEPVDISQQNHGSFVSQIVPIPGEIARFCQYNGRAYAAGQFDLDSCTTCECAITPGGTSATLTCSHKECHRVDQCIRYDDPILGECCGRCVEYGCVHNDTSYTRGARVGTSPCEMCYCPWDGSTGGDIICAAISCQFVACADPIVPHGKCCPVCPNEGHCWFGDVMISAGDDIWLDNCHSCYCPPDNGQLTSGKRTAMCYKHTDC